MVKVTRLKRSYANCYLLEGENGSILIDTCNYKDGPSLLRAVTGKNVKLILLTHCHFDHVSSAAYLSKRLNVPIAMSEKDIPLIGHGTDSHLHADTALGKVMVFFSQDVLRKATYSLFEPSVFLTDGMDLSPWGVAAHVVALPGHTPGTVGVLTDDDDFIVGDAMFDMFRPTGSRLYEDGAEMRRSVQKIRQSGATTIWVGHGNPIPNHS
ncbi:MAG: MBL fold metallo-hydrolase [Oscillospiraceae bacterium]